MTLYPKVVGKGAFQYQDISPLRQLYNVLAVVRITRIDEDLPARKLQTIPYGGDHMRHLPCPYLPSIKDSLIIPQLRKTQLIRFGGQDITVQAVQTLIKFLQAGWPKDLQGLHPSRFGIPHGEEDGRHVRRVVRMQMGIKDLIYVGVSNAFVEQSRQGAGPRVQQHNLTLRPDKNPRITAGQRRDSRTGAYHSHPGLVTLWRGLVLGWHVEEKF